MKKEKSLTQPDLNTFIGGGQFYKQISLPRLVYSEGVKYLAECGEAYWLIAAIWAHLQTEKVAKAIVDEPRIESLHFWTLTVSSDNSAVLSAKMDSPFPPFIEQHIAYTDFPLTEARIWVSHDAEGWRLFLPSEY